MNDCKKVHKSTVISARPNWLRSIDKRGNTIQSLSASNRDWIIQSIYNVHYPHCAEGILYIDDNALMSNNSATVNALSHAYNDLYIHVCVATMIEVLQLIVGKISRPPNLCKNLFSYVYLLSF